MPSRAASRQRPKPAAPAKSRPPSDKDRCTEKTARGTRCKKRRMPGVDLCAHHLGARGGRPTKLEDDVVAAMVQVLRFGGFVETAIATAGVSKSTFHAWMERGDPDATKREDQPYRDFRERIERARAEGEAHNVEMVAKGAIKDWRAAAWMLERQFPERWGGPRSRLLAGGYSPSDDLIEDDSGQRAIVGPDGAPL